MNEQNHSKGGIVEMLFIALPMFASMGCDAIMTFTDRIFLAKLSTDHMNASLGGGVFLGTLTILFTGLISYSTALVAQYLGAGFKSRAAVTTFQAILLSIIAYPILLIMTPLVKLVFQNMNLPANQLPLQIQYFSTLLWGSIFLLLRTALSSFFSGLGRTKFILVAAIASLTTNVFFNYVLIFGKWGFPNLGIKGAALGTNIGAFVGVLILFLLYISKRNRIDFQIRQSFKFNPGIMKKLLWYGSPQGIESFLSMAAFAMMVALLQSKGATAATAATIMFNWDYVSFMPLTGIQVATTSLVGKYMGSRDIASASKVAFSGIKASLIYSGIIFFLYIFKTDMLVNFFQPEIYSDIFIQAVPMAKSMLRLATIYILADAIAIPLIGTLRGAGDTHWTMVAFVIMHWLGVVALYLGLKVFNLSAVAGWGVVVATLLLFNIVLFGRYRKGKWKTLDIIND